MGLCPVGFCPVGLCLSGVLSCGVLSVYRLQDICADRESPSLSLYVSYHTPGHVVISKIKDDKIIYILQRCIHVHI